MYDLYGPILKISHKDDFALFMYCGLSNWIGRFQSPHSTLPKLTFHRFLPPMSSYLFSAICSSLAGKSKTDHLFSFHHILPSAHLAVMEPRRDGLEISLEANEALATAYNRIDAWVNMAELKDHVKAVAKAYYRHMKDAELLKDTSQESIMAACVTFACSRHQPCRNFDEMADLTGVSKEEISATCQLVGKCLISALEENVKEFDSRFPRQGAAKPLPPRMLLYQDTLVKKAPNQIEIEGHNAKAAQSRANWPSLLAQTASSDDLFWGPELDNQKQEVVSSKRKATLVQRNMTPKMRKPVSANSRNELVKPEVVVRERNEKGSKLLQEREEARLDGQGMHRSARIAAVNST